MRHGSITGSETCVRQGLLPATFYTSAISLFFPPLFRVAPYRITITGAVRSVSADALAMLILAARAPATS
ncbi:protein of unknown function [Candidatus Methylomirabilis oxygeniifera]|uniref:Uncharacterized protein n=1 Tax=Methylomirabilis oxygeniifera TaxID=671143 RepID=D5MIS5_METO1|nr:protein of unknown function [Candidatus Methylomirabilis oxyfera]